MSAGIAISAVQPCRAGRKGHSRYRVGAKASYVDETLFGQSSKLQNSVDEFDPPWASTSRSGSQQPLLWSPSVSTRAEGDISQVPVPLKSGGSPMKKNKYRLKCCKPSYCDESLFGPRQNAASWEAPWTAKDDKIKIRPLLWSPSLHKISSNVFHSGSNQLPSAKRNPMKPFCPTTKETSTDFTTEYKGKTDYWKRPDSNNASPNGTPFRRRSQSLTEVHSSIKETVKEDSIQNGPRIVKQLQGRPISVSAGFTGSRHCLRPRSDSLSNSAAANRLKPSSAKLNPPWKY
ncbi:RBPJ-interacting and tubulin-associated protein 1-like [Mobula hypostoma]|uniref:RBPJ-interacting and tubulin-associated protein 1-like n=1 Tax=Mobula hypostoma TaxID=723540 RepID=UPI002FC2808E